MTSRKHDVTPRNGSSSRRASGDPYELAHALIMLGAALQVTEQTLDAAIATLDEAVRVARAAGIDTALSFGLAILAIWLPLEESRTRRSPCSTKPSRSAPGSATAWASRQRRRTKRGSRPDVATGEPPSELAVDAAEQKLELGDLVCSWLRASTGPASRCARSGLRARGRPLRKADALTARTQGRDWVARNGSQRPTPPSSKPRRTTPRDARRTGAALDIADAVAYLRPKPTGCLQRHSQPSEPLTTYLPNGCRSAMPHAPHRPTPARRAFSSSSSISRACAWLGSMTSRRA